LLFASRRAIALIGMLAVAAGGFAAAPAAQTGSSAPASSITGLETFLGRLQSSIEGRDRRAVAAMVEYPITVLVSGLQVPIRDAATMVKTYDAVFTPDMENLIAQSGVPRSGQPPPAYAVKTTSDGMTIGGFLWIQRVGSSFKITRITVPPASSIRTVRHDLTRVSFPNGITSQLSGILARRDEVRSYLVRGQQGQALQVTITGFRGRDAVLRVLDAQKHVVVASTRSNDRLWSGALPATADYRIDVVRTAADTDPSLLYVLSVTLR
jgi:hypothetical protein